MSDKDSSENISNLNVNHSVKNELDTKEILKQNLERLIHLEKEHQRRLEKENEDLLDYSKEMIHSVTEK